jgi:integrase
VSNASLVLYASLPNLGWRRGSIVEPGVLLYNGQQYRVPNPTYQIRTYLGRKAVYSSIGNDYHKAQAMLERTQNFRELDATQNRATELNRKLGHEVIPTEKRTTLAEYAKRFMDGKKAPSKKLSGDAIYLYDVTITEFIKVSGKKFPGELVEQDVERYLDVLSERLSDRTRLTRYVSLRGFLDFAGVKPSTLISKDSHARWRAKAPQETEPYTADQLDKLLPVCTPYYKLIFKFLLSTGLRQQEAMHLTWANINWQRGVINVPHEQRLNHKGRILEFKTKNGKKRSVPLFASLRAELLAWREKNPNAIYVLGSEAHDMPNRHWLKYLKTFARRAGLNCGVCDGCAARHECEGFYLHKFRHTFAHRCLDAQQSLKQVSQWLGHSSVAVTSIYLSGRAPDATADPFA